MELKLSREEAYLRARQMARDLAAQRLTEVLAEIRGRMEAVLEGANPSALEEWREAAESQQSELFARLVHAKQDVGVEVPEALCGKLMPHQAEGLEWLASLYANGLHGILADEMGLGKTMQTIAFLLHLWESKGNCGPHFLVVPKSLLSNWQVEFQRFAPNFNVKLLTDLDCGEVLSKGAAGGVGTVCLTNYEQVYRHTVVEETAWQVVVMDEGHRMKNPNTNHHRCMAKLRCRMRLLVTGTPIQNSVQELSALLHYLLPKLFTEMTDFRAWFSKPFKHMRNVNEYEVQLDKEQEQRVIAQMHALLAPFLLQRLKSEVLGERLPLRLDMAVRVPLSAWQRAAYRDLEQRILSIMGDDDNATSEQVQNALMQLRKIALHPYLFQEARGAATDLFRVSGKAECLERLLAKLLPHGHKVLIFSQFTSMLDILEELLESRGRAFVRLDGSLAQLKRQERIARFQQDPSVGVFLLSTRAGGLGLNLQAADTVVLFDLDWNPQSDKQAVARVHRVGQTREVRVIRLLTDSKIEKFMESRCQEKLEMEAKIMGAGMFRKQASAEDRRRALREVLSMEKEGAGESSTASGLTSPEELNEFLARSKEELQSFADMDETLLRPSQSRAASVEQLLVQSGRLMAPFEVPKGFAVSVGRGS